MVQENYYEHRDSQGAESGYNEDEASRTIQQEMNDLAGGNGDNGDNGDQRRLQRIATEVSPPEIHEHIKKMEISSVRPAEAVNKEHFTEQSKIIEADPQLSPEACQAKIAGIQPPYQPNTWVIEGRLKQDMLVQMQHGLNAEGQPMLGAFADPIVRPEGVQLTERPSEGVERQAIPNVKIKPFDGQSQFVATNKDYISGVTIPADTRLRLGVTNPYSLPSAETSKDWSAGAFRRNETTGEYLKSDGTTVPSNIGAQYQLEILGPPHQRHMTVTHTNEMEKDSWH